MDYGSEAETNMAFFFRQSMRVQTYLLQKKDQLMLQIAYEKTGIKDEDKLRNKIHDEERFANNIAQDSRYVNFSNGTIAEATAILKQESMLDDTIGETLQ
ncbi:MAG: hypothetical protein H6766_04285 [Candidatus Peribacteria bacterium]|nr:MAG: hypothetical protein H6766_04285 [Candidatus Peribacteria bacterium]